MYSSAFTSSWLDSVSPIISNRCSANPFSPSFLRPCNCIVNATGSSPCYVYASSCRVIRALCKILQKESAKKKGTYMRPSDARKARGLPPPRQRPRHAHHHLALAKGPEVHAHADDVVEARVRALVQQQRRQAAQGVDEQSGFDAPVHRRQGRRGPGRRSRRGAVGAGVFVSGLCLLGCVVVGRGG